MRFGSSTLGSPQVLGAVTVQPAQGATWTTNSVRNSNSINNDASAYPSLLSGGFVYGATIVGTAAAANKAVAEILNPAASGKVLALYALDFFVPVAMAINIYIDGTSLAPVGVPVALAYGGNASVMKVGGGNQLAPTGSLFYTSPTLAANTIFTVPQQWIASIAATHNIQLQGQTVNQAFTCNARWVEPAN